MKVFGAGTLTVIDGSKILEAGLPETEPESAPAALLGVQVHLLTHACTFDIDARKPAWPPPVPHPSLPPKPTRRKPRAASVPAPAPATETDTDTDPDEKEETQ